MHLQGAPVYVNACAAIVGIGVSLSSVEFIVNWQDYRSTGLFSWSIQSQRRTPIGGPRIARLSSGIGSGYSFLVVVVVRLLATLALLAILFATASLSAALVVTVLLTTVFIHARHAYGLDGSDQMTTIVLAGLAIYACSDPGSVAATVGICFVAFQGVFSYFTSGMAKALSARWRSGDALFAILNTQSYGTRSLAVFLTRFPRLSKAVNWSVVAFEVLFPLAIVGGIVALVIFALGLAMHAGIAASMGLNLFFWSFISTYPAILAAGYLLGLHG